MRDNSSNEIAEIYNKFGKSYHESRTNQGRFLNECLEMPATLSLIPDDLTGMLILDAGCGSGIYARELAKRGATVIGVDISQTMIEIAQNETPDSANITYHVGNIDQIDMKSSSADFIICNYVLENIEDIGSVFAEFHRILKADGQCIYSISHPFRALCEKDMVDATEIWQLKNYFDNGIRISDFGHGMKVKKYKRTLSDYLNACIANGFILDIVLEPRPIKSSITEDIVAYETSMRLPQLLLVKMHI